MELLTLPLAFGNVTLAALTLVLTLGVLYLIVEVGLYIIKLTLAFDTEDAPKFNLKNPLNKLLSLLLTDNIFLVNGKFAVYKGDGDFWDRNGDDSWYKRGRYVEQYCAYKSRESAENSLKYKEKSCLKFNLLFKCVGSVVLLDVLILLLQLSFVPTLCVTLTFTSLFCIRTLAKKFYSGMKDHKCRLDGHDKEIEELKAKGVSDE